jgi:hypothetical protein
MSEAGSVVRAVGVDPGARTGLVCVELTPDLLGALDITRPSSARLVGAVRISASASTKLTAAEQDATLYRRVLAQLDVWRPAIVALEEPLDATRGWQNAGRRAGRAENTGTTFALGRAYGLALAAASCSTATSIASYPFTTSRKLARYGWMQGRAPLPTARALTLARMRALAMQIGGREASLAMTEDELMALGVLSFHVEQLRDAALAPRQVTA